jgi:enoyl-CoA hydratase/carnithine racemase
MSEDILIRVSGRAGRITLNRPQALNALTYDMVMAIEATLDMWRADDEVAVVVIDAAGDKAFCAGGDIAQLYDTGKAGDFTYGQRFWRDEYRMNAKLAGFPKPVVSFLQGFTMGGGVGVGCHASHRVVGESTKIAMPECGIGLIPDVGGSLLLARAPARLGEYLGITAARMGPGDAIHTGFADVYVLQENWPTLIAQLEETGDLIAIGRAAEPSPESSLGQQQPQIDALFDGEGLTDIVAKLNADTSDLAQDARTSIGRNSPLSMTCAIEVIRRVRQTHDIHFALSMEYRFTSRAMEHGDFLEGIRAAIIDKCRRPIWRHVGPADVPQTSIDTMLAPCGDAALTWE